MAAGKLTFEFKTNPENDRQECAKKDGEDRKGGEVRCLEVTLSSSGIVRMCDPAYTSGPMSCDN